MTLLGDFIIAARAGRSPGDGTMLPRTPGRSADSWLAMRNICDRWQSRRRQQRRLA